MEPPNNPEPVNMGYLTFYGLAEAMSYYLTFDEGTGLFCVNLPVVGNVCLWGDG